VRGKGGVTLVGTTGGMTMIVLGFTKKKGGVATTVEEKTISLVKVVCGKVLGEWGERCQVLQKRRRGQLETVGGPKAGPRF